MITIVVLIGSSGAGKSTIERLIVNNPDMGMNKIVSYTTRPMREGEVDGVDYHFISLEQFNNFSNWGCFAEVVGYNGNYYAAAKKDCTDDKVIVIEPDGLRQLLEVEGINVVSFYVYVSEEERTRRMIARGDSLEYANKRIVNDREVFKDLTQKVNYVIKNVDLEETVEKIIKLYNNHKII